MTRKNNYLFVIAGGSGEIGESFINKLILNYKVIGISRISETKQKNKNLSWLHMDLTNPHDVDRELKKISFSKYDRVFLIHSIGIDKFENTDYPNIKALATIDSKVYNSNVNTYKFIAASLIRKINAERKRGSKTKLVLSMIGSVADKHSIVFLTSFSESKNIVRAYIQYAVREYKWISGLVINISSAITKQALEIRPFADTTYWLTPQDVVNKSFSSLFRTNDGYREIDIYKKDPNFASDYYKNNEKIFRRWSHFVWGDNVKKLVK